MINKDRQHYSTGAGGYIFIRLILYEDNRETEWILEKCRYYR